MSERSKHIPLREIARSLAEKAFGVTPEIHRQHLDEADAKYQEIIDATLNHSREVPYSEVQENNRQIMKAHTEHIRKPY